MVETNGAVALAAVDTKKPRKSLPHLCFVAPAAWPVFSGSRDIDVVGGAEVQQSILARLFVRAGYRVSMICLDYGQPPRVDVDGVTVLSTHAPSAGLPGVRFVHPRLTSFWRAMREADADIYYQRAAGMLTGVVAAFCRHYGRHSIYAGASDPDFVPGRQDIRYARDRWLFERGLAWADRLVVQNPSQQQNAREHYGRDSVLIPSCYELPSDARPRPGTTVLWVGVMRPGKRPELFLELARRLPEFSFVMVGGSGGDPGDSAYFDYLRRTAQSLPNVRFTGFLPLDRVEPHFDRAAVLVNTSTHEGMPNTFLQAWARGIPTTAFIDTGARLAGRPVYPVVANIDEMTAEVYRLMTDDIHRTRVSAACRNHFAVTHSPASVLAQYERLFAELIAEDGR